MTGKYLLGGGGMIINPNMVYLTRSSPSFYLTLSNPKNCVFTCNPLFPSIYSKVVRYLPTSYSLTNIGTTLHLFFSRKCWAFSLQHELFMCFFFFIIYWIIKLPPKFKFIFSFFYPRNHKKNYYRLPKIKPEIADCSELKNSILIHGC